MNRTSVFLCGLLVAGVSLANAQDRTLQFDVNNLAFQARNAQGQAVAFGGLTHTGSLDLFEETSLSELLSVSIRNGVNPFQVQGSFTGSLTDMAMTLSLINGTVTGGSITLDINGGPGGGGDRYAATIGVGGAVSTYIGGGFKVDGLTFAGTFSDVNFSGVPIPDFIASQGGGTYLQGSFLAFKIQPSAGGSGHADTDIFVTSIPLPGSISCLVAAGLISFRRRR